MAKTDLGDKQVCPNCGAKFYDLRKRPAVCPKCTTAFDPQEETVRAKRGRSRVTAHDPAYDDDEDTEDKKKARAVAGDEDDEEAETEEAVEVDVEAEPEVVSEDEDDDKVTPPAGEELPEGFSEDEGDLGDDAAEDDGVPLLEDEEEFNEEELGVPGSEDDEPGS